MGEYCSYSGYAGTAYDQSVIWHYRTAMSRNVLNKWFVNIFEQGVCKYEPDAAAVSDGDDSITIPAGTSFIIEERTKVGPTYEAERKIAKVDMVRDYEITISALADGAYYVVAIWDNPSMEFVGVNFYTIAVGSIGTLAGSNYVILGTVTVTGGIVTANTTAGQTQASIYSGLEGWSGASGFSGAGLSGASGTSGYSGYSGYSGIKGDSGVSGYSGPAGAGTMGGDGTSGVIARFIDTAEIDDSTVYDNGFMVACSGISGFRLPCIAAASEPGGVEGLMYYDTTNKVMKYYNGTSWVTIPSYL